ncbi:MAG TPA: DUF2066 domain-containing protein [Stellaceae bacterium]|jgi:hypothetical protein
MTLPPGPVVAGARRPLAGALLVVLLLLCGRVLAQAPAPAAAGNDPYTTTVTVDATADNVVHARDKARTDGQRKALAQIADTLAGGAGKGKLPTLSDNQITDMVVSFEVANERMTTVRYTADYTYHFRAADVQRVLARAGIAAPGTPAAAAGKPMLVLPIYQAGAMLVLWDDPNPWRDAWAARNGGDHLILPLGDVTDLSAIDADKARDGDSDALTAVGKKYGTDDVLVAFAALRGQPGSPAGLDIAVKHYRAGQLVDTHGQSLDANPGEDPTAFFSRAAQATAAAIASNWQGVTAQPTQQGTLTVAVAITGLDDWIKIRDRITSLPAIRKIELRSLSRQEATVDVDYIGDTDQLAAALKALNFDLLKGDPVWHLSRSDAGASAPPSPGLPPPGPPPGTFAPPSAAPSSPSGSLTPSGLGK